MPALSRDLDLLTARTFDVLVVGGGIYGLAIAYDAAQRGLSVALIERNDFGSGSSFNHLRTIHGGLRYLQSLDIARARESVRERRTMAIIAPHAVQPMPFALPLYRSLTRGRLAMRLGFALDRIVASGRNRDVGPALRLPGGLVVSKDDAIHRFPGLRRRGLTGAAVWYDYITTEADRLTFSFALAAAAHGAVLANHLEATSLSIEGGRVSGVRAVDRMSVAASKPLEIRARMTVNATGASTERLLADAGAATGLPMLKAMNLVTRREAGEVALGGRGPSGRNLFLVPWRGRALFGTWESTVQAQPGAEVLTGDVSEFIAELNEAFPALELTPADISLVHRGIVPAVNTSNGRVALEGHERVRDHAESAQPGGIRLDGLLSVTGAKYTTARGVAERVTDQLLSKLSKPEVACRTATTPLPGGNLTDVSLTIAAVRRDDDRDLPARTIPHLVAAYGSAYRHVLDLCEQRPDLKNAVSEDSPVIAAELVWAARSEMAVTLEDAVVRRTPLGALGDPGEQAIERAAAIVGAELQWTAERVRSEIGALKRFYAVMAP